MTTPTTSHVVHLTRTIKASREAVFRAWTEPEQMKQYREANVQVGSDPLPAVSLPVAIATRYRQCGADSRRPSNVTVLLVSGTRTISMGCASPGNGSHSSSVRNITRK